LQFSTTAVRQITEKHELIFARVEHFRSTGIYFSSKCIRLCIRVVVIIGKCKLQFFGGAWLTKVDTGKGCFSMTDHMPHLPIPHSPCFGNLEELHLSDGLK
jgi:hypothetical protein